MAGFLSPLVLTAFGVMWQNVTDGALVTLLGGVREERIEEIVSGRVSDEAVRGMLHTLLNDFIPDETVMAFDNTCPDESWEELATNTERQIAYCRQRPRDPFGQ